MKESNDKPRMLDYALGYAQRGWQVFPVHEIKVGKCSCGKTDCSSPGKHPITKNGLKEATTDAVTIRRWWTTHPEANIGVATGKFSGFLVLDVDLPEGAESLEKLENQYGKLLETVEQLTGTGGRHLLFKAPAGEEIRNSTSKLGPNLDVRGDGGYIVVAPSTHSSGKSYTWCPGHEPLEIGIAEAPQWLIELAKSKPHPSENISPKSAPVSSEIQTTAYGRVALKDEILTLSRMPEGQRNDALNRSAFRIGQLVSSGEITSIEAETELLNTGAQMGLQITEVRATVKSGLQSGMANPRAPKDAEINMTVTDKSEPPRPLIREIPPSGEYPVDALGGFLGDTVKAVVDIVQVPPALAAGSVLAAASLAVQGHANVVLPIIECKSRPISLFLLTIAHSSDRKTTADSLVLKAVRNHEATLDKEYKVLQRIYKNKKAAYDRVKDTVLKKNKRNEQPTPESIEALAHEIAELGEEPLSPLLPNLTIQEPTIEGLAKLFQQGRPSLGLFSTEGAQMITGYAMREERKLNTAGGLSTLWDGETFKRTRIADGNYALPGRRLSLHLMVQPEVAQRLLSDPELSDQGLISRILVAAPESLAGTRIFREADPLSQSSINLFESALSKILSRPLPLVENTQNELNPRKLNLSLAARERWIAFSNETESAIRKDGRFEQIKAYAGKLAEHATRIAGVLTLFEDLNASEISAETMGNGCQLASFYAEEALRLFYAGKMSPEIMDAQKLLIWLLKRSEDLICLTDIYQFGPYSIREKAIASQAVRILVDHGWLMRVSEGAEIKGKFRREVWKVIRG